MMTLRLVLGLVVMLPLSACAPSRQAFESAIAEDRPPEDFQLSETVMRPLADTTARAAAYKQQPLATRPARYVLEADQMLRVWVGSSVNENMFPPETRQLTREQVAGLWDTLRKGRLADAERKTFSGAPPRPEALGEKKTLYIVAYSAAGDRRSFLIDPGAGENDAAADAASGDARALVRQLASLAWMEEPSATP